MMFIITWYVIINIFNTNIFLYFILLIFNNLKYYFKK